MVSFFNEESESPPWLSVRHSSDVRQENQEAMNSPYFGPDCLGALLATTYLPLDHRWTIRIGEGSYGLLGAGDATWVICGSQSHMIHVHVYLVSAGLVLIGALGFAAFCWLGRLIAFRLNASRIRLREEAQT